MKQVCKWFGLNPKKTNTLRMPFWDSWAVSLPDQAGFDEGGFLMLTETALQLHQRAKSHTCHSEKQPGKCRIFSLTPVLATPTRKWKLYIGKVCGDSWAEWVLRYENVDLLCFNWENNN